jgi:hypothetical protein
LIQPLLIAMPFAKKMDYLATDRDGSTGELVSSYQPVEGQSNLCDSLVYLSQPLPDKSDFLLHRLSAGPTEKIDMRLRFHKDS